MKQKNTARNEVLGAAFRHCYPTNILNVENLLADLKDKDLDEHTVRRILRESTYFNQIKAPLNPIQYSCNDRTFLNKILSWRLDKISEKPSLQ